MGSFKRCVAGFLTVLLIVAVGCQKLDKPFDMDLQVGDVKLKTISAPRSEQKVKVDVTASTPIDVTLVLLPEPVTDDKLLNYKPAPSDVLASQKHVTEATLEGTVPGGKEFGVLCKGASKDAKVTLKVTGR